jgi:hypothetical protein
MRAITTKYMGQTNTRGSRIKATSDGASATVHLDHSLNMDENHAMAAVALKDKLGWSGPMVGGSLGSGEMAWVFKSGSVEIR